MKKFPAPLNPLHHEEEPVYGEGERRLYQAYLFPDTVRGTEKLWRHFQKWIKKSWLEKDHGAERDLLKITNPGLLWKWLYNPKIKPRSIVQAYRALDWYLTEHPEEKDKILPRLNLMAIRILWLQHHSQIDPYTYAAYRKETPSIRTLFPQLYETFETQERLISHFQAFENTAQEDTPHGIARLILWNRAIAHHARHLMSMRLPTEAMVTLFTKWCGVWKRPAYNKLRGPIIVLFPELSPDNAERALREEMTLQIPDNISFNSLLILSDFVAAMRDMAKEKPFVDLLNDKQKKTLETWQEETLNVLLMRGEMEPVLESGLKERIETTARGLDHRDRRFLMRYCQTLWEQLQMGSIAKDDDAYIPAIAAIFYGMKTSFTSYKATGLAQNPEQENQFREFCVWAHKHALPVLEKNNLTLITTNAPFLGGHASVAPSRLMSGLHNWHDYLIFREAEKRHLAAARSPEIDLIDDAGLLHPIADALRYIAQRLKCKKFWDRNPDLLQDKHGRRGGQRFLETPSGCHIWTQAELDDPILYAKAIQTLKETPDEKQLATYIQERDDGEHSRA